MTADRAPPGGGGGGGGRRHLVVWEAVAHSPGDISERWGADLGRRSSPVQTGAAAAAVLHTESVPAAPDLGGRASWPDGVGHLCPDLPCPPARHHLCQRPVTHIRLVGPSPLTSVLGSQAIRLIDQRYTV